MGDLAKSTDAERFSRLHAEHAEYLARRIHSLQPWVPPSLHADVLQDVWMVVHRRIADVPRDQGLRPWLVKVVRNTLLHHARGHARAQRKEAALTHLVATHSNDDLQAESRRMIDQILGALPEEQREVVVRIEMFGESANEVAAHANLPTNTVYGRLRLARARISRMGLALGLWLAWLRASARELMRPQMVVLAGALALGSVVAVLLPRAPLVSPVELPADEPLALRPVMFVGASAGPPSAGAAPGPTDVIAEPPIDGAAAARPAANTPVVAPPDPAAPRQRARAPRPRAVSPGHGKYLQGAAEALQRGKGRAALRLLRRHRKAFPGHEQRHIADAYEVEALCLLGRRDDARAAFAASAARYARLPLQLAQRKKAKCW